MSGPSIYRRPMSRWAIWSIWAITGALFVLTVCALFPLYSEGRLKPTTCATEDSPCWDCHTMGNKICGPIPDMRP